MDSEQRGDARLAVIVVLVAVMVGFFAGRVWAEDSEIVEVFCSASIYVQNPCYVKVGYSNEDGSFGIDDKVVLYDRFKDLKIKRVQ